eukprot:TRINITY_DN8776_c0_g1_i4.p1 TRINITY_DN8776_c0_g1~~TRINITY_DN8776_c0_g1_i4.p1  ORF type:complete len:205 (-),score=46.23 TRINITY_DN8776_c0_g1_i4:121-735(-)
MCIRDSSMSIWRQVGDGIPAVQLTQEADFMDFSFFYRSKVEEMGNFVGRTIAERTPEGTRQSVLHEGYVVYCRARPGGLASVCLCDEEYDQRIAFGCCEQILDVFLNQYPTEWKECDEELSMTCPELAEALVKFQDVREADKITKIQNELEDVKEVLQRSIDQVLIRGEKLSDVVAKSEDLSAESKAFLGASENATGCSMCTLL